MHVLCSPKLTEQFARKFADWLRRENHEWIPRATFFYYLVHNYTLLRAKYTPPSLFHLVRKYPATHKQLFASFWISSATPSQSSNQIGKDGLDVLVIDYNSVKCDYSA